jgi:hypothetical protein
METSEPLQEGRVAVPEWTEDRTPAGVRRIARVRVPITLTVRPWATLYRLPDGRRLWCLRLWEGEAPRRRCVSTERLRAYARASGLPGLERELEEAERAADAVQG